MILLLGATGYVGQEFTRQLTLQETPFIPFRRFDCDLREPDQFAKHLELHQVSALINCIGYTGKPNVDACEAQKAECLAGNAVLPGMIAQACKKVGIPWGHVSSGCIYTGKKRMGKALMKTTSPIFHFDKTIAATIPALRHLVKKSWQMMTTATFGECESHFQILIRAEITYRNFCVTRNS
ncbi:sugar nucleotide-binding protein [bacterium]|nr:sugar nucleotide-binding protein [bacterium]